MIWAVMTLDLLVMALGDGRCSDLFIAVAFGYLEHLFMVFIVLNAFLFNPVELTFANQGNGVIAQFASVRWLGSCTVRSARGC